MTKQQHFKNFERQDPSRSAYAITAGALSLLWLAGATAKLLGAFEGFSLQCWLVLQDYVAGTAFVLFSLQHFDRLHVGEKSSKIFAYCLLFVAAVAYTTATHSWLQLVGLMNK